MHSTRCLLCLLMLAILEGWIGNVGAVIHANENESRVWHHRSGSKADAVLVKMDEDSCTVRLSADGREVVLQRKDISPADQKYIRVRELIQADARQFEIVRTMLPKMATQPKTVASALIQIHNKINASPYAGLLAGVATCLADNKHANASAIFREVKRRIEEHRELRGDEVHATTLASVLNNEAICRIKELKGSSAAALLMEAARVHQPMLPAASHNALILSSVAANDSAQIVLDSIRRGELLSTLATSQTADTQNLPTGFYYSTRMDAPSLNDGTSSDGSGFTSSGSSSGASSQPSFNPVAEHQVDARLTGKTMVSMGSGWVVAPGWVMTNRHVVELDQPASMAIAVLDDPTGTPQQMVVDNVVVSKIEALDLALLHVPHLDRPLMPLVDVTPPQATELLVLGFPQADQFGMSLMTHSGVIAKRLPNEPVLITDAKISGGNSGGPAINRRGEVIGIAYARHLGGRSLESLITEEKRGMLIDAVDAKQWIKNVRPDVIESIKANENRNAFSQSSTPNRLGGVTEDWPAWVQSLGPSVMPVLLYADDADMAKWKSSRQPAVAPEPGGDSGSTEGMLRDDWCIACDGTGRHQCPQRGCASGVVSVPRRAVVGQSFKGPVYGTVRDRQQCPTCRGQGARPCTQCRAGKI